jgi:hypothetical protein
MVSTSGTTNASANIITPPNNDDNSNTQNVVPLLVVPTRKKQTPKKPRIRPNRKSSASKGSAAKRKASKIGGAGVGVNAGSKKLKSPDAHGSANTTRGAGDGATAGSSGGVVATATSVQKQGDNGEALVEKESSNHGTDEANDRKQKAQTQSPAKSSTSALNSTTKTPGSASSLSSKKLPLKSKSKHISPLAKNTKRRSSSGSSSIRKPKRGISIGSSIKGRQKEQDQNQHSVTTASNQKSTSSAVITQEQTNQLDPESTNNNTSGNDKNDTIATNGDPNQLITRINRNSTTLINSNDDVVPYQHLGQLDPAWNIPPPKEEEKTMLDYCSRYKPPTPPPGAPRTNGSDNTNNGNRGGQNNNRNRSNRVHPNLAMNLQNNNAPSAEVQDNRSGPLVEVVNGEIVVRESTIILGRRRSTEEVDRELDSTIVVEDNTTLNATSLSFTTREKSTRWTVDDTKKFFLALRQCGTDFTTMMSFFDGSDGKRKCSRKQLKGKYKIECRKNMELIDMAMNPKVQLPLDLTVFGELNMDNLTALNPIEVDNTNADDTTTTPTTPVPSGMIPPSADTAIGTEDAPIIEEDGDESVPVGISDENATQEANTNPLVSPTQTTQESTDQQQEKDKEQEKQKENENIVQIALTPTGMSNAKKKKKPKFRAKPKSGGKKKPKARGKV